MLTIVLLIVVGAAMLLIGKVFGGRNLMSSGWELFMIAACIPLGLAAGAIVAAVATQAHAPAELAAKNAEYETIIYQMRDDSDVGKELLYQRVAEWNRDVAYGRMIRNNPWLDAFYPDIYDKIDFIVIGGETT